MADPGQVVGGRRVGLGDGPPRADVPATACPAATVILVRPGSSGGVEVFMVRRSASSRFAANAYVFPGGTVSADDMSERVMARTPGLTPAAAHARLAERGGVPPATPELSFGLHLAALRELFEEAGVLLAYDETASAASADAEVYCAAPAQVEREALQAGRLTFADTLERGRLIAAAERLVYFSHWITPSVSPLRFDTRFFVATMPPDQTALHCQIETTEGDWLAPQEALARRERGEIRIVFVTAEHLRLLADVGSVDEALRFACQKPIQTVQPAFDERGREWIANVEGAW